MWAERGLAPLVAFAALGLAGVAAARGRTPRRAPRRARAAPEAAVIRDIAREDFAAWLRLWNGYLAFYRTELDEEMSKSTFDRTLDPQCSMHCLGAYSRDDDRLLGFAVFTLSPMSFAAGPVCYLEDLFVEEAARGQGIGRQLILELKKRAIAQGWGRLYWITENDNVSARALYDQVGYVTDYVQYRVKLTDGS